MGKLNKNELLEGVRDIILNELNDSETFDGTSKFNIHRYVNNLIEEGHKNPDLMSYLLKYDNALSSGIKDFMIFEQFGQGLVQFAKGNKFIKDVINEMNSILESDGRNLVAYKLIENIQDALILDEIKEAYDQYVYNNNEETRNNLIESIEPLMILSDPIALQLNLMITEDTKVNANKIDLNYYNDSELKVLQEKLQEQRNKKTMQKLYEKVQDYIDKKFDDEENQRLLEQEQYCLNTIANNQGLNLLEHITKIRNTDARTNGKLMEVLDMFANAINQGAYEERLYENFLYNISKFNYLNPVNKAIKAITEKANSKNEEITLTKILEEMKDTYSSAIYVDLIQEDVARYVKEPNAINRVQLRNALMPYASDPFVNEMFNVLYADNSARANELTEKVLNIKEQINIIRENASVTNIYTPVQYVCENESIFNVNGQFYVKKGNNIALLEEKYVDLLNEQFVDLCRLVNDPHVTIFDDYIVLNGNEQTATIYEGYVDIHGNKESKESLRNLNEMCMKYDNYDTNFYIMCSCLLENFNNIAKVDWAKHVTLNENKAISADLFKLDQHIFMVTHNDLTAQHTFYRNINPIFCKNKLNEHMGINVSTLFADLLPSQDKIILKLNETKNSYEDSIEKYEDMIDKLKSALDDSSDENKDKLEKAIKDAEEKLEDVKKEYIDWQKQADDITGKSDDEDTNDSDDSEDTDDDNVTKEPTNEPIDSKEVDDVKDELSAPLQGEDGDAENMDNFDSEETDETGITDDEFASYLGSDDENEELDDSADDTDDELDNSDDENEDELVTFDSDDDDFELSDEVIDDDESDEEAFPEVSLFGDDNDDSDDVFETPAEDTEDDSQESVISDDESETEDDTDEPGEAATGMFGGNVNDPLGDDNEVVDIPQNAENINTGVGKPANSDTEVIGGELVTDEKTPEIYEPKYSYKIADVLFDENVKENKKEKSGSVIVIIPMIDGTGKKYVENKTIQFYLDDNDNPILDNDPMTNDLYAAVINSIKNHPDYSEVCTHAEPANELVGATIAPLMSDEDEDEDWEAAYLRDGNDEDRGIYGSDDEDEDDIWNFDDSVKADDEDDDVNFDFGFESNEDDETDDDAESTDDVIIPTYKSGNTEIEFPAPTVDNTAIPESVLIKKRLKHLKENKKIKITPVFKGKDGKNFFLSEATIKASKILDKKVTPLTEEIIDGSDVNEISLSDSIGNEPIENYNIENDLNVLNKMHDKACDYMLNNNIYVSDISDMDTLGLSYFVIYQEQDDTESYAVYQIDDNIYYRNTDEFSSIIAENDMSIEDTLNALMTSDIDEFACYNVSEYDDCMFLVTSIISSLTDSSNIYEALNENCKIRRVVKLDADNDVKKSKAAQDAKFGTTEENAFKQELEDKQKKDGTVGALDPQTDESVNYKPELPNVNLITEGSINESDIEYEVNDKVIYKGDLWDVFSITGVIGDVQLLRITKSGMILDVKSTDVKPDPDQLKDVDPTLAAKFDFDKNNLNKTPENPKATKMTDLNGKTVECNIVVDSKTTLTGTLNGDKYYANLQDILEGVDDVRVYLGNEEKTWNKNNIQITKENWPYAVIATEDDEPIRKIKVNPLSYVEAKEENDLVDCLIADKPTQLPKRVIRIIA